MFIIRNYDREGRIILLNKLNSQSGNLHSRNTFIFILTYLHFYKINYFTSFHETSFYYIKIYMAKDRQDLRGSLGRLQLEVVGQRQLAVLGAAGVLGPRPLELTSF